VLKSVLQHCILSPVYSQMKFHCKNLNSVTQGASYLMVAVGPCGRGRVLEREAQFQRYCRFKYMVPRQTRGILFIRTT
jgi:hypothetical protein